MSLSLKGNVPAIILVVAYLAFVSFAISDSARSEEQHAAIKTQASLGQPLRLKIPRISVDAGLERVGLMPDKSLGVPKDPANAGWFENGPLPGQIGSSVIDGHFGWWNRMPAAFDSLIELQIGDRIYVEYGDGRTVGFVVRDVRTFGKDESTSSVFTSSDGKAHLNLITCVGPWNAMQQSYPSRLVVFGDMITD